MVCALRVFPSHRDFGRPDRSVDWTVVDGRFGVFTQSEQK